MASEQNLVKHLGGCHCGTVQYEVMAPSKVMIFDCNCSICTKKQNKHFIVPQSRFKLLKGADSITTYTFNTHKAKHTFCKICGVQSFYQPRSNQDGYGIMPHCIDSNTITGMERTQYDGQNWEKSLEASGISKYSKE
ncbi:hypothetical protein CAPTEDRAFT_171327 [Capitella teleta]|uniref:CENP-V/GFA domain-containing protein n=1 Tax=Capitella teleta TaxID=283909 RepID=R7UWD7_CAPTE|nr:hypothetical protein CAPTEDRAFT_171327 [Capitella teleta]|eukprot:ELU10582.1 hypothetical protein CAPTEDRAFT_171327 [Capitella teleta]